MGSLGDDDLASGDRYFGGMGEKSGEVGMTGAEVVAMLGLEPLPEEGGMWREVWRDERSTAIYFLLQPGDFSAMHRLDGPELWHHYAGAAVEMLLLGAGRVGGAAGIGRRLSGWGAAVRASCSPHLDGGFDSGGVVAGGDHHGTAVSPRPVSSWAMQMS